MADLSLAFRSYVGTLSVAGRQQLCQTLDTLAGDLSKKLGSLMADFTQLAQTTDLYQRRELQVMREAAASGREATRVNSSPYFSQGLDLAQLKNTMVLAQSTQISSQEVVSSHALEQQQQVYVSQILQVRNLLISVLTLRDALWFRLGVC